MLKLFIIFCAAGIFYSCNGGLDPAMTSKQAVLAGVLHFTQGAGAKNFPPRDSLRDIRVVAFKQIPRDTNVIFALISGDAFFTSSLLDTNKLDSTIAFSFEISQVQLADSILTIKYLAAAQQYGSNAFSDWRVIGLYKPINDSTPTPLSVFAGQVRNDLDINVDFKKIPPQPFKR